MLNLHSMRRANILRRSYRGVTSIEYALIASLIALAIVSAIGATGDANASIWTVWVGKVVAAIDAALQ